MRAFDLVNALGTRKASMAEALEIADTYKAESAKLISEGHLHAAQDRLKSAINWEAQASA